MMRQLILSLILGLVWLGCQPKTPSKTTGSTPQQAVCQEPLNNGVAQGKINGISLVAPPYPYQKDPASDLKQLGASWVALLPYGYYRKDQPEIRGFSNGGWWGERPVGIAAAARYAQQNGLKVMLKPQLWTHNQWIGDLKFDNPSDWTRFEANYSNFILQWAHFADSLNIELFCIGTELRHFVQQRPAYWASLIQSIRAIYTGQLTYAPNWDSYQKVPFWKDLDYIGVDAYFPLVPADTPTVCALKAAWEPQLTALQTFAKRYEKPILFTEYGYLSVNGAAYNTWELEAKKAQLPINELAQARALQALLETFAPQSWWAGGFLWKWYPNASAALGEGQHAKDYTPQGKLGERVLQQLFE